MALSIDYLTRQTGSNLTRNVSLSIATILTVAVSLSLLGASLSIQAGVKAAAERFQGDIELLVWMKGDATEEEVVAVGEFLKGTPAVDSADYVDKETTAKEAEEFFEDEPEILSVLVKEELPTRYEVTPVQPDLASIESIGSDAEQLPGVDDVQYEKEYIDNLNRVVRSVSRIIVVWGIISAFASAMIMYNTIRTGLYARRKEIEVMRLVGATKWFIRIPYMLEGLIQGLVGAVISMGALFLLNAAIGDLVSGSESPVFRAFDLDSLQILGISALLFVGGALLGAVAAGIAVTRYLDA